MKSICYKKGFTLPGIVWLLLILIVSILIVFWVVKIETPRGELSSFTYYSGSGPKQFIPERGKYKIIILFSMNCPYCMQYLTRLNRMQGQLPDVQYGLFTTDKIFFTSSIYESCISLRQDSRFTIGILDVSTAYACFGDPPLPVTFIYDGEHKYVRSLRGDRDIRELLKWIPSNHKQHERKGVGNE
ncbi:hypothetical protein [Fidelibacter multiformis]|uniref:hypothetical protein n=1 Tax=Fidelibacter multiformis TaxID=3377529 RepID=UPI0037DC07B0